MQVRLTSLCVHCHLRSADHKFTIRLSDAFCPAFVGTEERRHDPETVAANLEINSIFAYKRSTGMTAAIIAHS